MKPGGCGYASDKVGTTLPQGQAKLKGPVTPAVYKEARSGRPLKVVWHGLDLPKVGNRRMKVEHIKNKAGEVVAIGMTPLFKRETTKCTCDWDTVLVRGCSCGGD
jgi:hypothetical protein